MIELLELRVHAERAAEIFEDNEGVVLGPLIRKVLISTSDPRMGRIEELQHEGPAAFVAGWTYHRRYSAEEIAEAEAFRLLPTAFFEPEGGSCGTVFNESTSCVHCGAGRTQVSDLMLDLRKLPKSKDFACSIASEYVVSSRLAGLMEREGLTGFDLKPVRHRARYADDPYDLRRVPTGRKLISDAESQGIDHESWPFYVWLNSAEIRPIAERAHEECVALKEKAGKSVRKLPVWYQLVITAPTVPTLPPTRFGKGPFDEDELGVYRCPLGHTAGLNLLSEVTVSRARWPGTDITHTQEHVGMRVGVFVPYRALLISPRFRSLMVNEGIKGCKTEVAHLS